MLLTQLVGLFSDGSELVDHFLCEDRDLAGVDHVHHTVNLVVQSHFLPVAWRIRQDRSGGTELRTNMKQEAESLGPRNQSHKKL